MAGIDIDVRARARVRRRFRRAKEMPMLGDRTSRKEAGEIGLINAWTKLSLNAMLRQVMRRDSKGG
jgi:hypothetical protein